ncbi:MAG: 50S ribosomal protein L25/general stress protein Ctc [Lactobacillales bacterium]|jgi:large subunit ribosomal protein L25|nr:50S ribosomal protein L25/general stress protein Ctc [Lactobacillales bacterium]
MKATQINASKREKAGKGASRANRRQGLTPAVIYGDKKPPVMISIEEKVLVAEMTKAGIWTRQYDITVGGEKFLALCQDIQKHPLTNRPVHADFLRISKDSVLMLDIPVHFINETTSPGIKMGGVLNVVHRTVEVECKPDNIPESFTIDLAAAQIGDSLTAFALKMPDGVKLTADEDYTIATIVTVAQEVEETPAAAAAPADGAAAAPAAGAAPAAEKKE